MVAALALPAAALALAYPQPGGNAVRRAAARSERADRAAGRTRRALTLPWNPVRSRPASEPTKAWITTDGHALYVRFDATQHEPIAAQQHTNDVGQGNDDEVWVDLWPNGISGYFYQFYATPNGTHYEYSSENTGYSPNWESAGVANGTGYTVTMKIPLDVLRNAHGGEVDAQFVRYVHATGEQQVWSYDRVQMQPDSYGNADYAHAGTVELPQLTGSSPRAPSRAPRSTRWARRRARPSAARPRAWAPTSRFRSAPTASFYSTFHPDYSNVELDQQSISPTVYQRYYTEVRPFFTQAANFYNQFNCDACPNVQALYTPAIPTPREGYAVEGKQGPIGFASFDSIGDDRNDLASALDYTSADTRWGASMQRVAVDHSGFDRRQRPRPGIALLRSQAS